MMNEREKRNDYDPVWRVGGNESYYIHNYVTANHGWYVIWPSAAEPKAWVKEPVLAWALLDEAAMPVTASASTKLREEFWIVDPHGGVHKRGERSWSSVDDLHKSRQEEQPKGDRLDFGA